MRLLSRALAWVEAVLFGPPDTAPTADRRAARDTNTGTTATTSPGPPANHPSPEMWAAFLASARRRRARSPWTRTELPDITADDIASTLVGAYVLTSEVREQRRQARQFAEIS
ncbi:hypothetical protein OG889_15705 [Streptomyces sp. NBC_00481]|uniref:hypothetical protein n=1 Tax=Streptomyces sp. NBC_00481 TaxID=2975755 RepID=UPI002DD819A8|nr:hypothetical protein [Streptomyces sp. NBC_00481]WRY96054.1 hypothetical protein OG889_15705 [Streptomyces sp. NBC_00481]